MKSGFSLIVATKNRPEQFARFIGSLRRQTWCAATIVVVDQSDNEIAVANEAITLGLTGVMDTVYLRSAPVGLSAARNLGLAFAERELVGFPDDDCWYDPRCLETVNRVFHTLPRVEFLIGSYAPSTSVPDVASVVTYLTQLNCVRKVNSVSLFVRTALLRRLSVQFDPGLGAGTRLPAGEELDFVLTLLEAGVKGIYLPELTVGHEAGDRPSQRWARTLALASSYVLARHAFRRSPVLLPLIAFGAVKALLRYGLSPAAREFERGRLGGYSTALQERCFDRP